MAGTDGKVVFIDRDTREVKIKGTNIDRADVGFSQIKILKNGKYGIIDAQGKETVACKYDEIRDFADGFAKVKQGNSCGIIDASGKEIAACKYDEIGEFADGYAKVKQEDKYGIIDVSGKEIASCKYQEIGKFTNGYAKVKYENKWGIIDVKEKIIVPFEYKGIFLNSTGYAVVINFNDKEGLVDPTGKLVIPCKYEAIDIADEASVVVKSKGYLGLSDISDHIIVNPTYDAYTSKPPKGTIGLLKNLSSTKAMCYCYEKGKLIGKEEIEIVKIRSVLDDIKKQAASYATVDCPKCNGAGHNGYVKSGTKTCWNCGGTGLTGKTEKETKVNNVSNNTVTVRANVTTTETAQKCPYCYGRGYTGTPKDTENTCDLCNGEKKVSPSVKQTYLNNK